MAASYHPALAQRGSRVAVVCPPLGFEYTHSHRTLRHLADALAQAGVPALRLDYSGTGDSAGDMLDSGRAEAWAGDIEAAIEAACEMSGAREVVLVGLRLGASFAAQVASTRDIDGLVLWSPIVSGRRFVREWSLVARTSSVVAKSDPEVLEAGGFPMSRETEEYLSGIDLTKEAYRVRSGVLLLRRADRPRRNGFLKELERRGTSAEVHDFDGYDSMMEEPQDTVVPTAAIETIVEWVAAGSATSGDRGAEPDRAVAPQLQVTLPSGLSERFVRVGPKPGLVGVLAEPAGAARGGPVLALLNSGSVHHVGPNRVYVELARAVAEAGVPVLRVDLRALGDSLEGSRPDENHPYPHTLQDDVGAILDWLRAEGFEQAIIGGICSGAYGGFQAGLAVDDPFLTRLLLVNPLTFAWKEGMSLAMPSAERLARDEGQYGRSIRDPRRWVKMLTGRAETAYIIRFVFAYAVARIRRAVVESLEALRLRSPRQLVRDLRAIQARGRTIDFVLSSTDPGLGLLRDGAYGTVGRMQRSGDLTITMIEDADHTFSRMEWRAELARVVISRLKDR